LLASQPGKQRLSPSFYEFGGPGWRDKRSVCFL